MIEGTHSLRTGGSDDNRHHVFIAIIVRMMTKMMDAKSMLLGDQWSARGSGGEKGAPGHQRAHRGPPRRIQTDLEFVKKFTRPNVPAKEFYTLKTRKSRLFSPTINSENASLSIIWPSFG